MPIMPFESTRRARCATTQSGCTSTYKDDAQDRGVLLITSTFCAARIHKCEPAFRSSRRVHLLPQTHGARCRLLRVGRGNISACGQANDSSPFERNAVISWHFERDPIPYALETDWPAGAAGFEPLHLGLQLAQDSRPGREDSNLCILESGSQLGARTRTCVSRITGAPAALSKNVAGVRPTTQPVEPR